jgi:L-amino acid N-acyltransferase YncA
MTIRTFQPGDEAAQVAIYNEAAADFPKFKPATLDEVQRRCRAADFDPATRYVAEAHGQPVGYATFHLNGRVSYPWCRKGHEHLAEPLFEKVLQALRARGLKRAFAAYRADWQAVCYCFTNHGFRLAREMVNWVVELKDLPTVGASNSVTPLRRDEIAAVFALAPRALRVETPAELERHLFHNPYFPPEAAFALRERSSGPPVAVGVLVANRAYADPRQVDAAMPCFRLGAFGTEGMSTKRLHGLFSFLIADCDARPAARDLLGHAAALFQAAPGEALAAQVPSDVPHLVGFYEEYFRKQGSFPVYEREL